MVSVMHQRAILNRHMLAFAQGRVRVLSHCAHVAASRGRVVAAQRLGQRVQAFQAVVQFLQGQLV